MRMIRFGAFSTLVAAGMSCASLATLVAQSAAASDWTITKATGYRTIADVTYLTANGHDEKLDLYVPGDTAARVPVLMYIHGGGWVVGDKEGGLLLALPFLEMGFGIVSVEYRLGEVSRAPAAVEDVRCALRWVMGHARRYGLDSTRIVVMGHSAGGHLALMAGMVPLAAGLDRLCPAHFGKGEDVETHVAAVVNYFGITDVADLLDGPHQEGYAVEWLGGQPDRAAVARRTSPLTYVRPGLPPIITIHGDQDALVPYEQAVRLRDALTAAGVPNQLVTITGKGHGDFTPAEWIRAQRAVEAFLGEHGVLAPGSAPHEQ
jgi:acetyl esterase/lipase